MPRAFVSNSLFVIVAGNGAARGAHVLGRLDSARALQGALCKCCDSISHGMAIELVGRGKIILLLLLQIIELQNINLTFKKNWHPAKTIQHPYTRSQILVGKLPTRNS